MIKAKTRKGHNEIVFLLVGVGVLIGLFNAVSASEFEENVGAEFYTSPEGTLICHLPILNSEEELTENYLPKNEGVSFNFNGDNAHFNRTQGSEQAKYIKDSMTFKSKLLAVEKYWREEYFDVMDMTNTKKEFITLGQTKYRLFIASGSIDNKVVNSTAQLYTLSDSNIIFYMITKIDKTTNDEMEKAIMLFYDRCKYMPN